MAACAFLQARPGVVTIRTPEQESRLSLTLPKWRRALAAARGHAAGRAAAGGVAALLAGVPLWPWFSLLALAILAVDWRLRARRSRRAPGGDAGAGGFSRADGLGLGSRRRVAREEREES